MYRILMGFVFLLNSEDLKSIADEHHHGSRYGRRHFNFCQLAGMLILSNPAKFQCLIQ
jgi:hypothetical protein